MRIHALTGIAELRLGATARLRGLGCARGAERRGGADTGSGIAGRNGRDQALLLEQGVGGSWGDGKCAQADSRACSKRCKSLTRSQKGEALPRWRSQPALNPSTAVNARNRAECHEIDT
nr:hypothetical protein GCM10023233_26630 [Brevibacterium otitidis]